MGNIKETQRLAQAVHIQYIVDWVQEHHGENFAGLVKKNLIEAREIRFGRGLGMAGAQH